MSDDSLANAFFTAPAPSPAMLARRRRRFLFGDDGPAAEPGRATDPRLDGLWFAGVADATTASVSLLRRGRRSATACGVCNSRCVDARAASVACEIRCGEPPSGASSGAWGSRLAAGLTSVPGGTIGAPSGCRMDVPSARLARGVAFRELCNRSLSLSALSAAYCVRSKT